jgi:hypothetical protein
MIAFGIGTSHDGALFATQPVLDHIWTWVQVGGLPRGLSLSVSID